MWAWMWGWVRAWVRPSIIQSITTLPRAPLKTQGSYKGTRKGDERIGCSNLAKVRRSRREKRRRREEEEEERRREGGREKEVSMEYNFLRRVT